MFELCIEFGISERDILTLLILKSHKRKYHVVKVEGDSYDLVYGVKNNRVWSYEITVLHE